MTVSVTAKSRTLSNGTANDATPVENNFVELYNNDSALATGVNDIVGTDSVTSKVDGKFIRVRNSFTGSPADGEHCGLEVERGVSTNVFCRFNETLNWWEVTHDGTNYYPLSLVSASDPSSPAAGFLWYNSTSNQLKLRDNSATRVIAVAGILTVEARSSNTIFAAGDAGKVIQFSSTFTQTFTAAATLGSGWSIDLHNNGTGIITLDPNGAETIDGLATIKMYPGERFKVYTNGTNFFTLGRQKVVPLETLTASNSTSLDLEVGVDDTEFKYIEHSLYDVLPATDGAILHSRVKDSTYQADAGDYMWSLISHYVGTADVTSSSSDTEIEIARAGQGVGNVANEGLSGTVKWFRPGDTTGHKHATFHTGYKRTDGTPIGVNGSGKYIGSSNALTGVRYLFSAGNITSGVIESRGVRA